MDREVTVMNAHSASQTLRLHEHYFPKEKARSPRLTVVSDLPLRLAGRGLFRPARYVEVAERILFLSLFAGFGLMTAGLVRELSF